jgi:hypothetical protein
MIIWNPAIDNTFVGPGATISVGTNIQGPLPIGSRWTLEIRAQGTEFIWSAGGNNQETHNTTLYPNIFTQTTGQQVVEWYPQQPRLAQPASSSTLTVRLLDNNGAVIDQDSTPVQWLPEPAGVAWVQARALASGTGGFTTTDRSVLNAVLPAVRTLLPAALPGGPQLLMQAIDLVRGPPRSLLRPFGSQLISGRGSLSAQPAGALHSFGGTWQVAVIPAGYGKDDGQVTEWNRRIGQFVVIREGASDDLYIDVLEDTHRGNDFILWQFPNPTQINYDIAPGVTLLWEWLV